jgi:riboflavin kinase/FMN adenylyltransferase
MLREGDVEGAARFLGRPFALEGVVIPGDQRGRSLGFPTSNLSVPEGMIDIQPGVYAGFARVEGSTWRAVTNIGFRPTFEAGAVPLRVETHLLDFSGDLYNRSIEISFQSKLREERKFAGVEELIAQIRRDVDQARQELPDQAPDF